MNYYTLLILSSAAGIGEGKGASCLTLQSSIVVVVQLCNECCLAVKSLYTHHFR